MIGQWYIRGTTWSVSFHMEVHTKHCEYLAARSWGCYSSLQTLEYAISGDSTLCVPWDRRRKKNSNTTVQRRIHGHAGGDLNVR